MALARAPLALAPFGALVAAVTLTWLGYYRPSASIVLLILLTVFVPYYGVPYVGAVLPLPGAVCAWPIASGAMLRLAKQRRVSLAALDYAVLVFVVITAVSVVLGVRTYGSFLYQVVLWIGPFLAMRLLLDTTRRIDIFVSTVIATALATLPFAIAERVTGYNPFHSFVNNAPAAVTWLPTLSRFGETRVEVSFGHPIAYSMFVAIAAVLSVGRALDASAWRMSKDFLAAASLTIGVAFTVSRTGWLLLAVGVCCVALRSRSTSRRAVAFAVLVLGVIALLMLPQGRGVRDIMVGSSGSSEIAAGTNYRRRLLDQALNDSPFTVFGNHDPFYVGSVDNQYLLLADRWGLAALAGFVSLLLLVVWSTVRSTRARCHVGIAAATLGALAALSAVAFITQQQVVIWALLGATAAATRHAASRRGVTE